MSGSASNQLLHALVENDVTTANLLRWPGGRGAFMAKATWGGGSVKLQFLLPDASTWVDVGTDTTLTASGIGGFELPDGYIKATITTATAVYAWVQGTKVA